VSRQESPLTVLFAADGETPNNPALPVLIYRGAVDLAGQGEPEAIIERLFTANGWGRGLWRNGVFPYIHYHPMIHEVLGIARGHGRLMLGGQSGQTFDVRAGDVAVLPAGTGHQRLSASDDFSVVGGYPPEGTYSLNRAAETEKYEKALTTISSVPVPASDPVRGKSGPLPALWTR